MCAANIPVPEGELANQLTICGRKEEEKKNGWRRFFLFYFILFLGWIMATAWEKSGKNKIECEKSGIRHETEIAAAAA